MRWEMLPASALMEGRGGMASWDRLNGQATRQVFMDANAISLALKHFGCGRESLLIGKRNEEICCMAVLVKSGLMRWTTFQPSQLPLGAFLLCPEASFENVIASLMQYLSPGVITLSFTQLDPLFVPRPSPRGAVRVSDHIETGWIDIDRDFEGYWRARSKNLRKSLRSQENRLLAANVKARMCSVRAPEEMPSAVARFGDLESAGWKGKAGTAVHAGNAQGRFYTDLMVAEALNGNAVVHEYWFDDRLAASNICLVRDKSLVVLKTAYNESLDHFSPAFLLRRDQIRLACDSGEFNRIEFYGRKRDWHTRWTEKFRTLYHVTAYRNAALRRAAGLVRMLG